MRNIAISLIIIFVLALILFIYLWKNDSPKVKSVITSTQSLDVSKNPLSIETMRQSNYPGSNIVIEQKLSPGTNYQRYVTSYQSEGLKIYALLTVPDGIKPEKGWPVIVFNHGYIPPDVYKTTERYVAYVDYLSRNGFIVFKPDYRGNGNSEGQPEGAYYSPAYATDDLNAISSIKKFPESNPEAIGIWGHSMGGNITLRDLVVNTSDIKAAVIWGGVVGSYDDLMNNWQRKVTYKPSVRELALRNRSRQNLITTYGTPQSNPVFWKTIDPTYYISSITAPIQLHHGERDNEVPLEFSESLYNKLQALGKTSEFYTYKGADHNISSPSFDLAMKRTVDFFNKYLKV